MFIYSDLVKKQQIMKTNKYPTIIMSNHTFAFALVIVWVQLGQPTHTHTHTPTHTPTHTQSNTFKLTIKLTFTLTHKHLHLHSNSHSYSHLQNWHVSCGVFRTLFQIYEKFVLNICCTLRSWLHEILALIMTLSPGMEKNYTLEWSFKSFPGISSMSGGLENCRKCIPKSQCSPIQETRS